MQSSVAAQNAEIQQLAFPITGTFAEAFHLFCLCLQDKQSEYKQTHKKQQESTKSWDSTNGGRFVQSCPSNAGTYQYYLSPGSWHSYISKKISEGFATSDDSAAVAFLFLCWLLRKHFQNVIISQKKPFSSRRQRQRIRFWNSENILSGQNALLFFQKRGEKTPSLISLAAG